MKNELIEGVVLSGTCGNSKWRDKFIDTYTEEGIPYLNPLVSEYRITSEEAYLAKAAKYSIIIISITGETCSLGSLGELGLKLLENTEQKYIIYIANKLAIDNVHPALYEESLRMRIIVSEHLKRVKMDNLFVVDSLDSALELSLRILK